MQTHTYKLLTVHSSSLRTDKEVCHKKREKNLTSHIGVSQVEQLQSDRVDDVFIWLGFKPVITGNKWQMNALREIVCARFHLKATEPLWNKHKSWLNAAIA